jgi:hypothetical protein
MRGPGSRAAHLADLLLERSEEFRHWWAVHEVGVRPRETKRYVHPSLGLLELSCQVVQDPFQSHALLVHTATPGTASHQALGLLAAVDAPQT